MRFSEVAQLIEIETVQGANGYLVEETEHRRAVYVDVRYVKRSEHFAGRRADIEMAITFVMRTCDYGGERLIEYKGKRYYIERSFSSDGEMLEFNCWEVLK